MCCTLCEQGVRVDGYDTHECGQFSRLQLQITAQVVHINTIHIATVGTVCMLALIIVFQLLTLMNITHRE